jgi:hypothetical protein
VLKKIWGFPATSWGVAYIVLSDYMDFEDKRSQTVISTIITRNDISEYNGKKPNEISNKDELIKEAFRQLKITYPHLPEPTYSIVSQNYYQDNRWKPIDTAFVNTKNQYIKYQSPQFTNLYNCGTQNGNSIYSFTSMESAISNSFGLLQILDITNRKKYKLKGGNTILPLIPIITIIIMLIIFYITNK